MKTIKIPLLKTLLGGALMAAFLISYSCTQEIVMDSEEPLTAVNAKADKGKKVERPWKIRSAGTFEFDPTAIQLCDPLLPLKISGSGEASHIGRYTVEITWCTGGPGNQDFDSIIGIITAANGDTINFRSVDGSFTENSVSYTIMGGSGRFEEAGGEFTLFATAPTNFTNGPGELPAGTYANAGKGTIIY